MAEKRGRPATGEKAKREVIAVRATQEFRAKIDRAAAASGRSMSQEIEYRLEQSFKEDEDLGGVEQAEILRLTQTIMDHVSARMGRSWLEDATGAEIVASAVSRLLRILAAFVESSSEPAPLDYTDDVRAALEDYEKERKAWEADHGHKAIATLRFQMKAHAEGLSESEKEQAKAARAENAQKPPKPRPRLSPEQLARWDAQQDWEARRNRASIFADQVVDALLRSRGIITDQTFGG